MGVLRSVRLRKGMSVNMRKDGGRVFAIRRDIILGLSPTEIYFQTSSISN